MRLDVLQLAAICFNGNEYLATGDETVSVETQTRSCYTGVDGLEFRKAHTHHLASPGAGYIQGTKMWFRRLKSEGVEDIRLHLPLSLTSPNPRVWGLVTDSHAGCDIWIPRLTTNFSTKRTHIELNAERFTLWNLRPPMRFDSAIEGLIDAWRSLREGQRDGGSELAKIADREILNLTGRRVEACGFEDLVPEGFSLGTKSVIAGAIRTAVALTADGIAVTNAVSATQLEAIWQQAMRCFESAGVMRDAVAA